MGSHKSFSVETVRIKQFWSADNKVVVHIPSQNLTLRNVSIAYSPRCLLMIMVRENDLQALNLNYEATIINKNDERWETDLYSGSSSFQIIKLKPLFSKVTLWVILTVLAIVVGLLFFTLCC